MSAYASVSAVAGTVTVPTTRSGRFTSVTVTGRLPVVKPGSVAVIVTVLLPSVTPSSTDAIGKLAEAAPVGMVTVGGRSSSLVLPETSATTKGAFVPALRVTV